jgi:membrane protein
MRPALMAVRNRLRSRRAGLLVAALASTRTLLTLDSVALSGTSWRHERGRSMVQTEFARKTIPLRTANSAAQMDALLKSGANTAVGSLVARANTVFASFDIPLSWGELLKRTAKETSEDDCLGLAAQLAYYFFLALFPAILFLIALASFFPLTNFTDDLVRTLRPIAPADVLTFLEDQLRRISDTDSGGILTIGILGAIWSSSAAVIAIIGSLNRAYDIEEGRPWWKVRLTAIGLTIALALLVVVSFTLIVVGPSIGEHLASAFGLSPIFEWSWKILQWPLAFFLVCSALGLVYYYAPDAEQEWVWITPGAVVGTVLWLVVSLAFKLYVARFADYNATYGAVGGVIVLLLWFYISGLAILVGAELNAEIEHASPYGKDLGEKVPGQKKTIGIAAARAYKAQLEQRSRLPVSHPVTRPIAAFDATPSANDRKLGAAVGLPLVLTRLWNRRRRRPQQGA